MQIICVILQCNFMVANCSNSGNFMFRCSFKTVCTALHIMNFFSYYVDLRITHVICVCTISLYCIQVQYNSTVLHTRSNSILCALKNSRCMSCFPLCIEVHCIQDQTHAPINFIAYKN